MRRTHTILLVGHIFLMIPTVAPAGIQREQFDRILALAQALYTPDFAHRHQRLRVTGYWESERSAASARIDEDRAGQLAVITVTGGLARHPAITDGAVALIVCHEIGHLLAGPPTQGGFSTEGQADYYAAAACMRRLLLEMISHDQAEIHFVPPTVKRRCESTYGTEQAREVCAQTIVAGYALSRYFAYQKSVQAPGFETPDHVEAKAVNFGTQTVQCRLDTYIAAALCNPQSKNATHANRPWLCSREGALSEAARPLCWYPRKTEMRKPR